MKCPGCGYESLDLFGTCKHCAPPSDPKGDFVELLDDDARQVDADDLGGALFAGAAAVEDDGPPFRIDDDLFLGYDLGAPAPPAAAPDAVDRATRGGSRSAAGADEFGPAFALADEDRRSPAGFEPIIDRDDEVPERYWAPEVAGLGRRALALLVDQSLLLVVLAIFFLGAFVALRLNGFDTALFLAAGGLKASALPFALLAALLSLACSIFFHGSLGCTPGKALVGIEVRNCDGGAPGWGLAILRWFGAALGLACAGVGILWAIFEPRRRGWADLISGTVVTRPQRESSLETPRR